MTRTRTALAFTLTVAAGLAAFVAITAGCQTEAKTEAADKPVATGQAADAELSGAQLWAQTCAHCHNSRSPSSYSDAEWDIAVNHMRQQACLTGDQTRKILEFLQASN